jgi:OmpA-OmpF porin, OOP family
MPIGQTEGLKSGFWLCKEHVYSLKSLKKQHMEITPELEKIVSFRPSKTFGKDHFTPCMQKLLFGSLFFISTVAQAQTPKQTILYADKVSAFSSEYSFELYSSRQILGEPNALPVGGDNPFAWSPKRQTGPQFITVGFPEIMEIDQIAIGECYNPGAISKVIAIEPNGKEHLINQFSPKPIRQDSRLLHIFLEERSPWPVKFIRIELDCDRVPGFNSIDFVAVSDGKKPIEVKINDSQRINPNVGTERLTEKINSPYDEVNPIITPDGKRLYFGRKFDPNNSGGKKDEEDIWYSDWNNEKGEWGIAKNLGSPFNNEAPNFICSISPDGKSVLLGNEYIFGKKVTMKEGVSMVSITENGWGKPKALKIKDFKNEYKRANFYLCQNRKVMILAIRAESALGGDGMDLYVSFLEPDSSWTKPLHMGQTLNSVGNESAPFLAADDKTLFFSSDGFSGYGSDDIFMSRRLDDSWTNWSKPANLGKNINTGQSDIFFTLPTNGDYAYFSSGGKESNGQLDLYRLRIPDLFKPLPVIEISGRVLDKFSKKPLRSKIVYENLTENKNLGINESDPASGKYKITIPVGAKYGYLAQSDGYMSVNQSLDATNLEEAQTITQDLYLMPIKKGTSLALNNIFFDYNKSDLNKESFAELNRLTDMMKANPKMKIAIGGHTDSKGSDEYNLMLSKTRAEAVQNYLLSKGIPQERMAIKMLGKSDPLTLNEENPDGAALNRRVDITVDME